MRRLWDRLTRRLCAYVGSKNSDAMGRGDAPHDDLETPAESSYRFSAVGCRRERSAAGSELGGPTAHEDAILRFVVDTFPLDNVTWRSYYLSVAGVGLAFFLAQRLHVGVVSALDPVLPTIALMGLLSLGGIYQLYTREVFFAPPP